MVNSLPEPRVLGEGSYLLSPDSTTYDIISKIANLYQGNSINDTLSLWLKPKFRTVLPALS